MFRRFGRSIALSCLLSSIFLTAQSSVLPVKDSSTEVLYAHEAEVDPLNPLAPYQRKEALSFSAKDHSSHVTLCHILFTDVKNNKSAYSGEITSQYLISASAFLYQHPDAAKDHAAQNAAGLNAALNVYLKFLESDARTKSEFLDKLQEERVKERLDSRVASVCR